MFLETYKVIDKTGKKQHKKMDAVSGKMFCKCFTKLISVQKYLHCPNMSVNNYRFNANVFS